MLAYLPWRWALHHLPHFISPLHCRKSIFPSRIHYFHFSKMGGLGGNNNECVTVLALTRRVCTTLHPLCMYSIVTIHIHTLIHPPIHLLTHSFTHPDTFVHHVYRGYLLLLLIIAARDKIDEEKNGISRPKSHVMNICLLFAANGQYFITPYYMYTRSRFQTIDFRVECTSI